MKARTALFSVLLFALPLTSFSRTGIAPGTPTESSHRNLDAIDWKITMPRAFTNFDSIEMTTRIVNSSNSQFTFHTDRKSNIIRFELTPMGKPTITRDINISLPPQGIIRNLSGNYKPKPKETIWSFQVDIRTLFGRLAPGKYSILMRYPSSSFRVRDTTLMIARDLRSPAVAFTVSKTSIEEAAKSDQAKRFVTLTVNKARGPHGAPIGTLTNNLKEPISFAAYIAGFGKGKPSFKPPLSTTMTSERWHPQFGWQSTPVGFCGTGLGSFSLSPGASVTIYLASYHVSMHGIYRYRLQFQIGGKERFTHTNSEPVIIGSLKGRID